MRQSENKGQHVSEGSKLRGGAKAVFSFLLVMVVFGVAYTQPALYYSNQNQYFLHGLARGGRGFLNEDWLAHTADPTPVFSALIAFTYRYLPEWFFYIYYLFILGIYLHALAGIFTARSGGRPTACAAWFRHAPRRAPFRFRAGRRRNYSAWIIPGISKPA